MAEHNSQGLTIGGVAKAAGENIETIRFYQRKGLLLTPPKPQGGIRRYSCSDVERLGFIRSAQQLGFSLNEIRELLALEDGMHCDQARVLAEQKLHDVREKLDCLNRIAGVLSELVKACNDSGSADCCPLISSLRSNGSDKA